MKHNSKCAICSAEIVMFWLGRLIIICFSQVFGPTVPIMQDLGLHGGHGEKTFAFIFNLVPHNVR